MGASFSKCCGDGDDAQTKKDVDIEHKQNLLQDDKKNSDNANKIDNYISTIVELNDKIRQQNMDIREYKDRTYIANYLQLMGILDFVPSSTIRGKDATKETFFKDKDDPFELIYIKITDQSSVEEVVKLIAAARSLGSKIDGMQWHKELLPRAQKNGLNKLTKDDVDEFGKRWLWLNDFEKRVYTLKIFDVSNKYITKHIIVPSAGLVISPFASMEPSQVDRINQIINKEI